jgi:hypothetical protein
MKSLSSLLLLLTLMNHAYSDEKTHQQLTSIKQNIGNSASNLGIAPELNSCDLLYELELYQNNHSSFLKDSIWNTRNESISKSNTHPRLYNTYAKLRLMKTLRYISQNLDSRNIHDYMEKLDTLATHPDWQKDDFLLTLRAQYALKHLDEEAFTNKLASFCVDHYRDGTPCEIMLTSSVIRKNHSIYYDFALMSHHNNIYEIVKKDMNTILSNGQELKSWHELAKFIHENGKSTNAIRKALTSNTRVLILWATEEIIYGKIETLYTTLKNTYNEFVSNSKNTVAYSHGRSIFNNYGTIFPYKLKFEKAPRRRVIVFPIPDNEPIKEGF